MESTDGHMHKRAGAHSIIACHAQVVFSCREALSGLQYNSVASTTNLTLIPRPNGIRTLECTGRDPLLQFCQILLANSLVVDLIRLAHQQSRTSK
jgi:hypothetical protein